MIGHSSGVNTCAWSPDGTRLVSSSGDRTVKVWDAASGQCLLTLQGHQGEVNSCAWSPDGARLVSGADDRTVKVWDAASGACLWTGYLFPELQVATIDATDRVTHASPEAWRFLAWRWFDPDLGRHRLLPAETFGPLPS
jgi:WD40 repeat protein